MDIGVNSVWNFIDVLVRQCAELPHKTTFARNNIECRAPFNRPDMNGGVRRVKPFRRITPYPHPLSFIFQKVDDPSRVGNRVDARMRPAGMSLKTGDVCTERMDGFMGIHDFHHRGFANDDNLWTRQSGEGLINHRSHSKAANFFIIGQRKMHRALEPSFNHVW